MSSNILTIILWKVFFNSKLFRTGPECHAGLTLTSVKPCSRVTVVVYKHERETFHCYLLMTLLCWLIVT